MAEEFVTLSEAGQMLEKSLGQRLTRQQIRWLIERKGAEVTIHEKAVVVEVSRKVRADAIRVVDLVKLEATAREVMQVEE